MPAVKRLKIKGVRWVSDREMASIIDRRARAVLNVSGATFLRNRRNGKYKKLDADDCPGIVELSLLAPSIKGPKASGREKS